MKVVHVLTHRRREEVAAELEALRDAAAEAGWRIRVDPDEAADHGLEGVEGVEVDDGVDGADLCLVLGGDGTILHGLRRFAGTGVPVFAVNFGEIGFLAAVEREDAAAGLRRALAGKLETVALPAIDLGTRDGAGTAINDVAIHRRVGARVARLAYTVAGEEVGSVRCDGLVVATPVGSTGYNLANGGPVLAWGVEGFVVSFIAPHSLTARALVVAPQDTLTIHNRSRDAVDLSIDGRPTQELAAGDAIDLRFRDGAALLAQLPGSSFYRRLREKFGRLSS